MSHYKEKEKQIFLERYKWENKRPNVKMYGQSWLLHLITIKFSTCKNVCMKYHKTGLELM